MKVFHLVSLIVVPSLGLYAQNAPIITTQPTSLAVPVGATARFSVSAVGAGPITYQWQFNGANLTNINNPTNLPSIITTVAIGLFYPSATAVDSAGSVYLASEDVEVLRPNGSRTVVVKAAAPSLSVGDGGPAANASVNNASGVAVDQSGNLYIADSGNARIRRVGTNGIITTIAGTGVNTSFDYSDSGDGGPATNATLWFPTSITVDTAGRVFFTDFYNGRVRKIDPNGTISTVAGGGTNYPGDGGSALDVHLLYPGGVAMDSSGNLFFGGNSGARIHKVGSDGIIWTVAGGGNGNALGDGGAGTNATLFNANQLAIDRSDNLFIADTADARIRKLTPDGIISTVAGNGNQFDAGDGGPAANAGLDGPRGVCVDDSGNLFTADYVDNHSTARKISAPGTTLELFNLDFTNSGNYSAIISSPYGSVTSSVVKLNVTLPPLLVASNRVSRIFHFMGSAGQTYILQSATSLNAPINWRPVFTNAADASGYWSFTNSFPPTGPSAFYRAALP